MPTASTTQPQADWSDVESLQRRLLESSEALTSMTPEVGLAKHVQEYDSDLRKRALARAMSAALAGGASAAKAEAEGRSSELYNKELSTLAKQHQAACETIAAWEAQRCAWETARSLLSVTKATMHL